MFSVKRNTVVIRLSSCRDTLAKSNGVRRDAHVTPPHQLERKRHFGVAFYAARFFLSLSHGLMQANHRRTAGLAQRLWHQKVSRDPILRLAPDQDMTSRVALEVFHAQLADLERGRR